MADKSTFGTNTIGCSYEKGEVVSTENFLIDSDNEFLLTSDDENLEVISE